MASAGFSAAAGGCVTGGRRPERSPDPTSPSGVVGGGPLIAPGQGDERSIAVKRKGVRRVLGVLVGFLAVVGVGASVAHYLYEPYNLGFLEFPTVVALHVALGGVYLALAPLQFVGRIRSRHLGYHRWAGRVLVSIGIVLGAAGLFMGLVIPFSGWIERAYIGFFGSLFLAALLKG